MTKEGGFSDELEEIVVVKGGKDCSDLKLE